MNRVKDYGDASLGFIETSTSNYQYDDNGNTTFDPDRGITIAYNHLNLPTRITKGSKALEMLYDAAGNLLQRREIIINTALLSTRDYINGTEYLDGNFESAYHAEGRVHKVGSTYRNEYHLKDHLGNVRLVYADLNNDGLVQTPSEIIKELHYYPFGMTMEGPWMGGGVEGTPYQYNGIELVEDMGLDLNMAFYRTLDPSTGRWWQVNPKGEMLYDQSPYAAMNMNPITYSDPYGDIDPITLGTFILSAAKVTIGTKIVIGSAVAGTVIIASGGFSGFGGCPTCPIDYQVQLPQFTVTANPSTGYYDHSPSRYGYNGSFAEWRARYGFSGLNYRDAQDVWGQLYAEDHAAYVSRMDGISIAQRLLHFGEFFSMMSTVVAPGGGGGPMSGALYKSPLARSFSYPKIKGYWITPEKIMKNPRILEGVNGPQRISFNMSRWKSGPLGKGRSAGKGFSLRQWNSRGTDFTNKYIQYHPGTHRHFGGSAYWKVSGFNSQGGGIIKFPIFP